MNSVMQFEELTINVASYLADLLRANVTVTDPSGEIMASGAACAYRAPFAPGQEGPGSYYLRIPLVFNGFSAQVHVVAAEAGEAVSPKAAQMLMELMINQLVASTREQTRAEMKDKFTHDLLHGLITEENEIHNKADVVGLDLSRPRGVILIESGYVTSKGAHGERETGEAGINKRAQSVINSIVRYFKLPSEAICAYVGNGQIAVLKALRSGDLQTWAENGRRSTAANASWANLPALKRASTGLLKQLQDDTGEPVTIGIGRYHPGPRGLAASYEDACTALQLGRDFLGSNRVHCLDELGSVAFLGIADMRTKQELARHLLSPLRADSELMDTLQAYIDENCCPAATAERLSVHRNTLHYRLNKIHLLTGLDPRQFEHLVQINLALTILSLA